MSIAFFDSGIGGLTVLGSAARLCPQRNYLYYADTDFVPYGSKPRQLVRQRVIQAADFLVEKNIEALVVACNTATAVAIEDLRQRYSFPVIGMEPAIKPAIARNNGGKVLVMATSLTLQESKLSELLSSLDSEQQVERLAMDELVSFAESFDFDSAAVKHYIQERLSGLHLAEYESLVLGCTHFIYFKSCIAKLFARPVNIIDGNEGTVRHLFNSVPPAISGPTGLISFYSSGKEDDAERVAQLTPLLSFR
ncbi:glutamate racemase [Aliidiomarina minuta]|uniref:Glutamate racemase n=1 Tax=Aliidiomarina minuta TaxID=880057 RepID=A0A432WAC6_9GAMM|nr:glutamate racemase [Aliidiomarina minuta]